MKKTLALLILCLVVTMSCIPASAFVAQGGVGTLGANQLFTIEDQIVGGNAFHSTTLTGASQGVLNTIRSSVNDKGELSGYVEYYGSNIFDKFTVPSEGYFDKSWHVQIFPGATAATTQNYIDFTFTLDEPLKSKQVVYGQYYVKSKSSFTYNDTTYTSGTSPLSNIHLVYKYGSGNTRIEPNFDSNLLLPTGSNIYQQDTPAIYANKNKNDYTSIPTDDTWRKYEFLYMINDSAWDSSTEKTLNLRFHFNNIQNGAAYMEIADPAIYVLKYDTASYPSEKEMSLRTSNFNEAQNQFEAISMTDFSTSIIASNAQTLVPETTETVAEISTNNAVTASDIAVKSLTMNYPIKVTATEDPSIYNVKVMSLMYDKSRGDDAKIYYRWRTPTYNSASESVSWGDWKLYTPNSTLYKTYTVKIVKPDEFSDWKFYVNGSEVTDFSNLFAFNAGGTATSVKLTGRYENVNNNAEPLRVFLAAYDGYKLDNVGVYTINPVESGAGDNIEVAFNLNDYANVDMFKAFIWDEEITPYTNVLNITTAGIN